MFKFLHTSDLHLGKVFYDQSLVEDQAVMLEDLAGLLEDESYAALVIAGDVYDRSIPSPEAVELFGSFLWKVKKRRPSVEILIIPGNHDSASRLGFGRELFARLGIHFAASAGECEKPVVIESGGGNCAIFLLPFIYPGVLSGESPIEEAARRMNKARQELALRSPNAYTVLAAHLFASGAEEAGSERVFLGNAEHVKLSLFSGFDYIALGHLHRCQNIGGEGAHAFYSGSPLAYSFAEAGQEKFFLSVGLDKDGVKLDRISVKPRRKVTSLSGLFTSFSGDDSSANKPSDAELAAAKDDYLEIRLTDREVRENARDVLRRRFPNLLSLRQDEALSNIAQGTKVQISAKDRRERQDLAADFRDFLFSLYGDNAGASAELELFNSLLVELETADTSETVLPDTSTGEIF